MGLLVFSFHSPYILQYSSSLYNTSEFIFIFLQMKLIYICRETVLHTANIWRAISVS